MTTRATIARGPETAEGLFPGWWQVVAGFGHAFLGYGVWLYGWSAFVPPMVREFGWGAGQVAGANTLAVFTGALVAPLAGWIADRRGPRWLSTLGIGAAGLGFLFLGFTPSHPGLALAGMYFGYGVLVSLGMNGGLYLASFTAANRWFVRQRSLAMGLISLGAGVGAILVAPLCQGTVGAFGWRGAALLWGGITLGVGLPLARLFKPYPPEHYGLQPDGEPPFSGAEAAPFDGLRAAPVLVRDFTLGQAAGTWGFWALALASLLHSYTTTAFPLFQNLRMQELGFTPQEAAAFFGLQFLVALLGRGTVALVGDRLDPRWSMALVHISMAAGVALFALAPRRDELWMWGWVILWGYAYGGWAPLGGALRGAYFGRASFGRIWGTHNAVAALGGLVAPIIAGWSQTRLGERRDVIGSYQALYLLGAAATALAALLYAAAPRPKGQFSYREGRRSTD